MSFPKCSSCISEFVEAKAKRQVEEGREYTEEELYEPSDLWDQVRDADTFLVAWQEKIIGDQMIVAPVSAPVCMKHIGIRKPDLQEMAMRSGLALPR
jgi:hypothetical protein